MKEWEKDKRWSDKFLPEIKQILGLYLIGEPPIEEDAERNTDLIVLKMEAVRIACRIRRYEYFLKYPDEITIRCGRPNGYKTEMTKIIEGWGDYFFYGFADQNEERLFHWVLCNMSAFRLWCFRQLHQRKKLGMEKRNGDGSSSFLAFSIKDISNLLVGTSE